jgi:hypothetical protein
MPLTQTPPWLCNTADLVSAACGDAGSRATSIQVKIRRNIRGMIAG